MEYIRARDTYPGVVGGKKAYLAWLEFERHGRRESSDINARIAKDVDRLENLVQLRLYGDLLGKDAREEFAGNLLRALDTEFVSVLADSFEGWVKDRGDLKQRRPATISILRPKD
jgi:hypothetical protein